VQALIGAAKNISGPGIIVPTRNAELFRWCLHNGLRVLFPLTLMTRGLYSEPTGDYLPSIFVLARHSRTARRPSACKGIRVYICEPWFKMEARAQK
jgi:hypothetical protein